MYDHLVPKFSSERFRFPPQFSNPFLRRASLRRNTCSSVTLATPEMQGFIVGEGKQDGSRMIRVKAHSHMCKHACLLGGSGGMPPLPSKENFEF